MKPLFIGREAQRAFLGERIDEARDGRGGAVLVLGDAGLGKSALLEQLASPSAREGTLQVVWGRAWEAGGAPPFWPWTQALRALERGGWSAPDSLAPMLAPDPSQRGSLPPGEARFVLLEAVSQALCEHAARHPTLVVLDDLHAADPSSMAVLEVVADAARHVPLLVVAAAREGELRSRHPEVFQRLDRRLSSIRLEPLSRLTVRRYVEAVGGHDAEGLFERSEGHPLYLEELVRLQKDAPGSVELPATIDAALRSRLDALPASARQTLALASVWGREVRDVELAALMPEGSTLAADLEAARTGGFLHPVVSDGERGHRFRHILQREAAYALLSDARPHHEVVARTLEERPEPPWIEIAHHLRAAGRSDRYPAVRAAVRDARARLAFDEALELAEEGVAIAPAGEAVDAAITLAEAQLLMGDFEGGRRTCLAAAEEAERSGDARALGRVALAYGSVILVGDPREELAGLLQRSLDALEREDPEVAGVRGLRAEILARLAAARHPGPDPDPEPAFERAREAVALARRVDEPEILLRTMRPAIAVLMDLADPVERLEANLEYVALAEQLGDTVEVWRGQTRSVFDRWELGDFPGGLATIDAAEQAAEAVGLASHRWSPLALRAGLAVLRGDFDRAAALRAEAGRIVASTDDPRARRVLATQALLAASLQGSVARIETAVATLRSQPSFEGGWLATRGLPVLEQQLRILRDEPVTLPREWLDYAIPFRDRGVYAWLALPLARTDDRDAQGLLAEALEPHLGRWWSSGFTAHMPGAPLARAFGLLRAARGELDAARDALASAVDAAREAGAEPLVARCLWELAAVEAATGASAAAEKAEAEALAERLGMTLGPPPRTGAGPGVTRPSKTSPAFRLERDGETWRVIHGERTFRLKDTRGVRLLDRLVREVGQELHVLDLAGAASMLPRGSGAMPALDDEAKAAYRARVRSLRARLAEAEDANDLGRMEHARAELEALEEELSRALGIGGRDRKKGSVAERARVNVQRRLKDALRRIGEHDPVLARHLDRSLTTGTYCRYEP